MIQENPNRFTAGAHGKAVTIGRDAPFRPEVRIELNGHFIRVWQDTPGAPTFVNDIITFVTGTKTHRFREVIDHPSRSYLEQTIEYQIKPANEVFNIEYSPGLELVKQIPFTDPEYPFIHPKAATITENAVFDIDGNLVQSTELNANGEPRTDIVGSYSIKRQTEFGKEWLGYLFAPIVTDDLGDSIKVNQTIEGNTLTYDFSDPWFDTATYPVTLK
jgi:hypothetical protein